jgi:hypothetical protein
MKIKSLMLVISLVSLFMLITMTMPATALSNGSSDIVKDEVWKQYLETFLMQNYPSFFDKETIKKNEELLKKWENDFAYIPELSEIPIDAYDIDGKWHNDWSYYPMLLPLKYKFYDLDNDGIPEIIICYPNIHAEGNFSIVYKLYGSTYEKIDTGKHLRQIDTSYGDSIYINPTK